MRHLSCSNLVAWLTAAGKCCPDGALDEDAVGWVAEHLGPPGYAPRRVADVFLAAPVASETTLADLDDELGADLLAAMVWLAAAAVACWAWRPRRRSSVRDTPPSALRGA